ncbi:MAG: hypothetical protein ACSLFD_10255, partial [Solirubrobacterales bacterium]
MNRRRRAVLLTVLAVAAAGLAVTLVNGYSSSVVDSYGAMRPVAVVTSAIDRGADRLVDRLVGDRIGVSAFDKGVEDRRGQPVDRIAFGVGPI